MCIRDSNLLLRAAARIHLRFARTNPVKVRATCGHNLPPPIGLDASSCAVATPAKKGPRQAGSNCYSISICSL
eukprot:6441587-Alexandrium_andersonii.AAC.1